jgi:hypothetical protein
VATAGTSAGASVIDDLAVIAEAEEDTRSLSDVRAVGADLDTSIGRCRAIASDGGLEIECWVAHCWSSPFESRVCGVATAVVGCGVGVMMSVGWPRVSRIWWAWLFGCRLWLVGVVVIGYVV